MKTIKSEFTHQQGVSLVVVLIVLLALTTLALAATNNNSSQALMVRNTQLRMDSFNASYTEIDAQISGINRRTITQGPPDYVIAMTDGRAGTKVDAKSTPSLPTFAPTANNDVSQEVSQEYFANCIIPGEQLGKGGLQCSKLVINVDSTVANTTIGSDQSQVYRYTTLEN